MTPAVQPLTAAAVQPSLPPTYRAAVVRAEDQNLHQGKVGVLCLAPRQGMGMRDPILRARHVDAINRFGSR
jgi:crotonyl-CoA reductase